MNIFYTVLAQLLRHFLQIAAGALAAYGITHDMQNELVEAIVTAIVPVVLFIVANYSSFIYKRYMQKLVELAHNAPADVPMPVLEAEAKRAVSLRSQATRGKIGTLLFAFALGATVLINTGCPKVNNATIRSAKEASAKMSESGKDVIQANIDAVKANEITPEEFAKCNDVTRRFVAGVKYYRQAIKVAEASIKAGEDPKSVLERLEQIFQSSVVDHFLKLVDQYGLIPGANSETVRSILDTIRISINLIRAAFSEHRTAFGSMEVIA